MYQIPNKYLLSSTTNNAQWVSNAYLKALPTVLEK